MSSPNQPGQGNIQGGYGAGSMAGVGSSSGTQTSNQQSSGSNTTTNKIASMSPFETNVMGTLGGLGSGSNSLYNWGTSNLAKLYQSGMTPTKAQQKSLGNILQANLAADKQGLSFSLLGPGGWLDQVNNNMADRGMTNSSVDSLANQAAVENAQNLMNQDVQGAVSSYNQGILTLPFQNMNLLTGAASLGQGQQGIQAGINQNLLGTLTQRDLSNSTTSNVYNNLLKNTSSWNQSFANSQNSNQWSLTSALGL